MRSREPDLTVELAGIKLKNPVMLASGPLGSTGIALKKMAEYEVAAVVTKSVSLEPIKGHPLPRIARVPRDPYSMLCSPGLPNPGYKAFTKEIKIAKEGGVPVIASLVGKGPEEYQILAQAMEKAGADMLELNFTCPHPVVKGMGIAIGTNLDLAAEIARTAKEATNIPVLVKLNTMALNIVEIAKACEKAGADGISILSGYPGMAIDIYTARPILGNPTGEAAPGGLAMKPIAVKAVADIARAVKIPVIGSGAVHSWRDAVEYLLVGALGVQVLTAAILRGPGIFIKIINGIQEFLKEQGYSAVTEIMGTALKHLA